MGDRWNCNTSIYSINGMIVSMFEQSDRSLLLSERVPLSLTEYDTLCDRLVDIRDIKLLWEYGACIVAAWVNSFRLGRDDAFLEKVSSSYRKVPAETKELIFKTFPQVFSRLGVNVFGIEARALEDIHDIMQKNALL